MSNRNSHDALRRKRIPLSVTLSPESFALLKRCVSVQEFGSIDEVLDVAIGIFRIHLDAMLAHIQTKSATGLSDDEIVQCGDLRITFEPFDR